VRQPLISRRVPGAGVAQLERHPTGWVQRQVHLPASAGTLPFHGRAEKPCLARSMTRRALCVADPGRQHVRDRTEETSIPSNDAPACRASHCRKEEASGGLCPTRSAGPRQVAANTLRHPPWLGGVTADSAVRQGLPDVAPPRVGLGTLAFATAGLASLRAHPGQLPVRGCSFLRGVAPDVCAKASARAQAECTVAGPAPDRPGSETGCSTR
jgi:hypothetical protein